MDKYWSAGLILSLKSGQQHALAQSTLHLHHAHLYLHQALPIPAHVCPSHPYSLLTLLLPPLQVCGADACQNNMAHNTATQQTYLNKNTA